MKISNILISQPAPASNSPYAELISKYGLNIDFKPFFRVEPLNAKEFRAQKINILDFTAIVFTARTTIDAFFHLCEELRINVPETMKYFCNSEAIALYLQKHIIYRKRKIFFGNGTTASIIETIGIKHKDENFLLATTDNLKGDIHKLFTKAKLKHDSAAFIKTINANLSDVDLTKYQLLVFYSPSDIKSLIENFPEFKPKGLHFATFGTSTAKAMKAAKLKSTIIAPTPQAPSIAKALSLYFEKK
ncbi:MAG: uroporphyrinogen-III synthase [Bacteroidales bacterium]